MQVRRKVLLAVALVIGLADVGYGVWLSFGTTDEMKAVWVAYMPALDEKQRQNPYNALSTSESRDPEYPSLYLYENGQAYPLFVKLAYDCKIQEYQIRHHVGPTKDNKAVDMPDRLFLGNLSSEKVACLRISLPKGYILARLESEIVPRRIGWGDNDLHVDGAR
jgi:hypothetical protein